MTPGEIYLARFPFGDAPGMKLRPVLALSGYLGPVPEVVVAYISSVSPTQVLPTDVFIDPARSEHATSGLKSPSVLRLHKLATIHASSVARRLGNLSPATQADARDKLRVLLGL